MFGMPSCDAARGDRAKPPWPRTTHLRVSYLRSISNRVRNHTVALMVASTNHLLDALPSSLSRTFLNARLKKMFLYQHQILLDVNAPIHRVYFPVDAVIALVVPLSSGLNIKTAMVGRDGLIGGCAGLGIKHSTSRAVVHISGQCLWCEVETLTYAIAEISGASLDCSGSRTGAAVSHPAVSYLQCRP
jgi:hypothetical protein